MSWIDAVPSHGRYGGRFWPISESGHLVNNLDCIPLQSEWVDLIADSVAGIRAALGASLYGLYLRGSVAEARARRFCSDVDLIALTSAAVPTAIGQLNDQEVRLLARWPILREASIDLINTNKLLHSEELRFMRVILKVQSRLLHGEDIRSLLPMAKPGIEMIFSIHSLESRYRAFCTQAQGDYSHGTPPLDTLRFFRAALRAGFELLEPALGRFTRDVDLCSACLAARFPEETWLFDRLLDLAIPRPTTLNDIALISDLFMELFREQYATFCCTATELTSGD
jgi:hypothetical protein